MTETQQLCREQHGFWLWQGETSGVWYVSVPDHVDPTDGLEVCRTRLATEYEVEWWLAGEWDELARALQYQGVAGVKRAKRCNA